MEKYEILKSNIRKLDNLAVAFSGGVDSSFLAYVAHEVLGDKMIAITMCSPYMSKREIDEAIAFAKEYDIRHEIIDIAVGDEVKTNPDNRCYICKKAVFSKLIARGQKLGFSHFADGTNLDDLGEYRPGLKALAELGVLSPLKIIKKSEIRACSSLLGLPTADKPSYACLLTRLPYDYAFTETDLERIEWAENLLINAGFANVRARYDGTHLKLELPYDLMVKFINDKSYKDIIRALNEKIDGQITLDLRGLRRDVLV